MEELAAAVRGNGENNADTSWVDEDSCRSSDKENITDASFDSLIRRVRTKDTVEATEGVMAKVGQKYHQIAKTQVETLKIMIALVGSTKRRSEIVSCNAPDGGRSPRKRHEFNSIATVL